VRSKNKLFLEIEGGGVKIARTESAWRRECQYVELEWMLQRSVDWRLRQIRTESADAGRTERLRRVWDLTHYIRV